MHSPAITVMMPVRDGARHLRESIDSVLGQTFRDIELVVVDDGSTDATPEILRSHASRDSRVVVLRQEPQGVVTARNRCLAAARAPLIACLDADDIALPERLARQFDVMQQRPVLALLGSHAETIDENGNVTGRRSPANSHADLVKAIKRGNPFIQSTIMFRKKLAADLGGYRKAFVEGAEDYDLWLRISERSDVANLSECLARYRISAAGMSARFEARSTFLVRLAKRSAAMRAAGLPDLANDLTGPPDWHDPPAGAFYADDARDYRLLQFANGEIAQTLGFDHLDATTLTGLAGRLNHAERSLAQRAILNIMDRRDRPAGFGRARLWALFFRLHPARAASLVARRGLSAHKDRPGADAGVKRRLGSKQRLGSN